MITGTRSRTTLIMGPEHLYIYLYFSSFFYHVTGSNTHMCVGASNELQKESHPGKKHYRVKLRDQLHEPFYSTSELPLFLVFNSVANDVTKLAILIAYYPSGKRHGSETILRTRENREGWPLLWKLRQMLTQEVHIKEILRCLFRWDSHAGKKDFVSYLGCSIVGPVQNIVSFFFTFFVPIAQQAGQAVMPRRLSLNMCLWSELILWWGSMEDGRENPGLSSISIISQCSVATSQISFVQGGREYNRALSTAPLSITCCTV